MCARADRAIACNRWAVAIRRKLKAFLIDAKVPRVVRDRLPLVVTSAGIAWVAGIRPAEWAKVVPATRLILRLQFLRHASEKAAGVALDCT